ncbi:hypothetical protein ACFYST_19865 [Kitasatospora sp. NPDC004614]|uniref:hypothetical protein n=1 Tax=unclassified Kitasatospora TaxID=2633591 RepID=UPI0036BC41D6
MFTTGRALPCVVPKEKPAASALRSRSVGTASDCNRNAAVSTSDGRERHRLVLSIGASGFARRERGGTDTVDAHRQLELLCAGT